MHIKKGGTHSSYQKPGRSHWITVLYNVTIVLRQICCDISELILSLGESTPSILTARLTIVELDKMT